MKECIFCKIINNEIQANKVYEDNEVIVIMDSDPSQNGHLLIIPKKHYTDFTELDNDMIIKVNAIAKNMKDLLYDKLNADGIRLVNNFGLHQVVKHYHLHVIPAYKNRQELLSINDIFDKLK